MQGGDQPRQRRRGIRNCPAVDARMQIGGRPGDTDLERHDPAQSVGESRHAPRDHARVGNGDQVAAQFLAMRVEECLKIRAPDFLFALDEEDQIHGQFAAFPQRLLDPEDVGENLSLVVRRAAREDDAIGESRLEGRRGPEIERIHRLHVVVAVDHHRCAGLGGAHCARRRSGGARSDESRSSTPIAVSFFSSQRRAGRDIAGALGIGGNAREPQEIKILVDRWLIHDADAIRSRRTGKAEPRGALTLPHLWQLSPALQCIFARPSSRPLEKTSAPSPSNHSSIATA